MPEVGPIQSAFSLGQLREIVQPRRESGGYADVVRGVAALPEAEPGQLSFLGNAKYKKQVADSRASVILLPLDWQDGEPAPGQCFLFVENPSLALAKVCARIEAELLPAPEPGVHPSAVIDGTARVDPSAAIGPQCVVEAGATIGPGCHLQGRNFVGRHASIGADCHLFAGSIVQSYCRLGKRVRLQSGVVVGGDGFGFEPGPGGIERLPQIGIVVLEDDVDVGANSTIDRARFGETRVGAGTKIDNLVMIAHNCVVGKDCFIVGQAGISGSCTIGDGVIIAGQVGLTGHLKVGDGARIGAQSGVNHDIEAGAFVRGTPTKSYQTAMRLEVLHQRLPQLFKKVEKLEELVKKEASGGSS
jgi:UDP-3-O-[3-hydroxymyristoyl] glucosamine N-acyltransferase